MSGCSRQHVFSKFQSGARASELLVRVAKRRLLFAQPDKYRVELALCLCFCLMAVNEKRGQRGALIANVGNRGNLPEGGARERADGEQPT
jgi:hypothetical protein